MPSAKVDRPLARGTAAHLPGDVHLGDDLHRKGAKLGNVQAATLLRLRLEEGLQDASLKLAHDVGLLANGEAGHKVVQVEVDAEEAVVSLGYRLCPAAQQLSVEPFAAVDVLAVALVESRVELKVGALVAGAAAAAGGGGSCGGNR